MSKISKTMLFLLVICFSIIAIAKEESSKEDEKIYTQKEFDKKVNETVLKKIDEIKKKSISDLTKELYKQKVEYENKEKDIIHSKELLKMQEEELASKILSFESQQKKVLGCISENQNNKNKRIDQLVEMISNMKPDKAAELLSVQTSDISVLILAKIEAVKASKIFNLMEKEVSARLQKEYLNMKQ